MGAKPAVPYIQKHLLPGERLIASTRIHPAPLWIWGSVFVISAIAACAALVWSLFNPAAIPLGLGATFVAFVSGWCVVWTMTLQLSTECGLTDRRLIIKAGWLVRTVSEMPLDKVEWLAVEQGPLARRFDYGNVAVISSRRIARKFRNIRRPFDFCTHFHEQLVGKAKAA